jgi:hypothetical protein
VLGEWFNWAFLVPEANAIGIAFLEGVLRVGYPPPLIYKRRSRRQFKSYALNSLQLLGWKTNVATRVQLISNLDRAIREFGVILVDPGTVAECRNFVIKANGRTEAQDGDHDDEVIALGLAPPTPQAKGLSEQTPGGLRKYGVRRSEERGDIVRW